MDQRERLQDAEEVLRAAMNGHQSGIWSSVVAIVETVNANGTLSAQPTTQGRVINSSGEYKWIDLPLLVDCPILYLGGGGFIETFPIAAGDEVLIICASRCIEPWWQVGGVQRPLYLRMHSLSDGFALCGPRSQPRKIPNVSTTTMQLRSLDGTQYIELAPGGVVNITAPGGVNITGNVSVTGAITATGEGLFNGGHTVSAHKHIGVQTGSGVSGIPEN